MLDLDRRAGTAAATVAAPGAARPATSAAPPPLAPLALDIHGVRRLLPQRYPMLMVDRVDRLEPGVYAEAIKCVTANEPFLAGHFPEYPIMPGVLIVEAMAQAAGIMLRSQAAGEPVAVKAWQAGPRGVLASIQRMRFLRPVFPGDRLVLKVRLVKSFGSTHRVAAEGVVDGQRVAVGELVLSS